MNTGKSRTWKIESDPIRVYDIKLPLDHADDEPGRAAARALGIDPADLANLRVVRRSVDARKKRAVLLSYVVDVTLREGAVFRPEKVSLRVAPVPDESYRLVETGTEPLAHRPVIVGSGPAGLFAALVLSQMGYRPLILERGRPVERRIADVNRFLTEGKLDPLSNVQFGEGGAGTFSDGKLYTLIRDVRCRKVLEELVRAGAPGEILVNARPHVGTDRLRGVVRSLREEILAAGGEYRFESAVTGLIARDGKLAGVRVNEGEEIPAAAVILAIGHSARDTFAMLHRSGVRLSAKPFSIGLRIEHFQEMVDRSQYGPFAGHPRLGAAEYKLACRLPGGRSVYTFCMCPGGAVIAAASEPGGVVTNGMSFFSRNGPNANSALLVGVGPEDFGAAGTAHPLAGMEFQRRWEREAFARGGGDYRAPAQRLADFLQGRPSARLGAVKPTYLPGVRPADLGGCLPGFVTGALREAMPALDRTLRGFAHPEAVLTGVETRSSSPVRIERDEGMEASIRGLYPAGEGSGYAGGIVSAAVDGIRAAEAMARRHAPPR